MGLIGFDDFPMRAVVSDCEPFKLKGRLKEGVTDSSDKAARVSSAVALCAEDDFLQGRAGAGL